MRIESSAFADGSSIPVRYTCDGQNISPPLRFVDVPKDAQGLLLIMEDPDAPEGSFIHWIAMMSTDTQELHENISGMEGVDMGFGSSGTAGYTGPCPPSGMHHYVFHLYAIARSSLGMTDTTHVTMEDVNARLHIPGMILAEATFTGIYQR